MTLGYFPFNGRQWFSFRAICLKYICDSDTINNQLRFDLFQSNNRTRPDVRINGFLSCFVFFFRPPSQPEQIHFKSIHPISWTDLPREEGRQQAWESSPTFFRLHRFFKKKVDREQQWEERSREKGTDFRQRKVQSEFLLTLVWRITPLRWNPKGPSMLSNHFQPPNTVRVVRLNSVYFEFL